MPIKTQISPCRGANFVDIRIRDSGCDIRYLHTELRVPDFRTNGPVNKTRQIMRRVDWYP